MPAAYTALKLTDGTTTADLVDNSDYQLLDSSWAPAVSTRRQSRMAGQAPYENVLEEIQLTVIGTDGADALGNLATLTYLLDQADRFWEGDDVAPVTIKCQPQGSDLTNPVEAMVLGRPPGDRGFLGLPPTFNDYLHQYEIGPIRLRFLRTGLWLGDAESPAASTPSNNPTIEELTFAGGTHKIPSPVDVAIQGFADNTHTTINPGILLVTNTADQLQILDAEDATATDWTSETDAGNEPVSGNVLRYTATDTDESTSGSITVASFGVGGNVLMTSVYASVRVNTSGKTFFLRAEGTSYVFNDKDQTADFPLPYADYSSPTWIHLGYLNFRKGIASLQLVASVDDATSSPTLDIDSVVLMAVTPNAYAIEHEIGYLASPFVAGGPDSVDVIVEQRVLTERTPFVGMDNTTTGDEAALGHEGDQAIYMTGTKAATLWLSTNGNDWVDTNQSTGAVITIGMDAGRRLGYLTPV